MNVRLQSDLYNTVTANPSLLRNYESVISGAMSLPGDVVRLNILAEGQEPVPVYVDKRGPQPVFTTNDKRIINAYRP